MQNDPNTKAVTQMDVHEIELYKLYRTQLALPNGKSRDQLPYTIPFDQLLVDYNAATNKQINHQELWDLLRHVNKYGDDHIERYLNSLGIVVPPKP